MLKFAQLFGEVHNNRLFVCYICCKYSEMNTTLFGFSIFPILILLTLISRNSKAFLIKSNSRIFLNRIGKTCSRLQLKNDDIVAAALPQVTIAQVGDQAYELVSGLAERIVALGPSTNETQRFLPVTSALLKIQRNMDILDNVAGRTPQLSRLELLVLGSTVLVSAISPAIFPLRIVEVLVPSLAAVAASIGLSSEYVGKVAVSKAKEISALAIQAAAEAEALLASAERAKAILPLCVGIATTASAFALLAPNVLSALTERWGADVSSEILLLCPLISVLAAAVAGLATQESQYLASRATGLGTRRFATREVVGKTWLSVGEQVDLSSERLNLKWRSFAIGVLPAPIVAVLFPGSLALKTVVCAAVAAAQAAYCLAIAEYYLSSAVETVALKARSSAVADTYANQSSRAGAILPFTSALAGLCAAASAAAVELLPLIHLVELQSLVSALFPSGAALFAAAATVAKARCEVGLTSTPFVVYCYFLLFKMMVL